MEIGDAASMTPSSDIFSVSILMVTTDIPQPVSCPYYDKWKIAESRKKVLFRPIRTVRYRSFYRDWCDDGKGIP